MFVVKVGDYFIKCFADKRDAIFLVSSLNLFFLGNGLDFEAVSVFEE